MSGRPIATPCIKVCQIDPATAWCLGCGRNMAEIGGWTGFTPVQRGAIMDALPARLARMDRSRVAPGSRRGG